MGKVVRIVVGLILTVGLGYASYWVWLEVQAQVRGTIIASFGIFAAVIAAFLLLSLAHTVYGFIERRIDKDEAA